MTTPTKPGTLLLLTAAAIFVLEGLIMAGLHLASAWVSRVPAWVVGTLDASVLSVLVFPVLYWVWFRPLCAEMASKRANEAMLKRSHAELEARVRQRTQELTKSNESFRILTETAKDAIISSDDSGRVTFWNAEAERLFGYRAEEMLHQPLTRIMPERFRDAHTAGLQRFQTQGELRIMGKTVELAGLKKDGSEFPIEISLASWSIENKRYVTAILRDITTRRRYEQALKAVVEGTASSVKGDFFNSLVRHLAAALGVRYALVAVRSDETAGAVHTLAIWSRERLAENFSYELDGTPCQRAEQGEVCFYSRGIQRLFPNDSILRDMQAESYVGAPLVGASGQVVGHLAALDDHPMQDEQQNKSLIAIFAARAGAEIERASADKRLRQERDELARMNSLMMDREGRILELKREVNELLNTFNQPRRYRV